MSLLSVFRYSAMGSIICFTVLSLLSAGSAGSELVVPAALRVDGREAPLDLDQTPRFGWQVNVPRQTAYEIRVASTLDAAIVANGDVWASGKVISSQQNDIFYQGPGLNVAERYYWTVRTWDGNDSVSAWSTPATFGIGPGSEWQNSDAIWAPSLEAGWTDYRITTELTVDAVAAGIRFRAPDINNGYMWQFRGGDNRLVPHLLVNGGYSVLETVDLPAGTLATGKKVMVELDVAGSTIRTSIDGVLVHTMEDATFAGGGVGVRTGRTETFSLYSMQVNQLGGSGKTLLDTDFADSDRSFVCGTVIGGTLSVPVSAHCLNTGLNIDWAFLRSDVEVAEKSVAWATVFATADSPLPSKQYVYKLYINGEFVGLGPTQPLDGELRYDGFDVTGLINSGQTNTIGVIAYTTQGQALQAELWVAYSDGSQEVFGTDDSWKALSGDYALPAMGSIGTNYYAAPKEYIDARYFPEGFTEQGFDDSGWLNAQQKPALTQLAAAPIAKVTERYLEPLSIIEKSPGHYFIDFGRTWVGGVSYTVGNGVAGETIDMRFGEVTSAPETVRYELNTGNVFQDIYTMRNGSQTFETWGMRVFRYVEILGAPEPVTVETLKALALVYPFDATAATFSASDANLEDVWQLSKNTIEALNVNFYTDSWTRERTNYEADAYLQLMSSAYLMDDLSLGRYAFDYFKNHRTWPTEWPLYVILAVHDTWRQTGSTAQLHSYYGTLKALLPDAWFDPASQLIRKTSGSNGCNSSTDCDIVDWPTSQRDGYVFSEHNTVVNALAYRAYMAIARIAEEIGSAEDASLYSTRASELRNAINRHMYQQDIGYYDDGLFSVGSPTGHSALHASAFPLAFGIPEPEDVPRVAEYVASRGMVCSVYCAPFLIGGLYNAGYSDAALNLLAGEGTASWVNMISLGAGATAEAWDPSMKSNLTYSHPWAASPAFLIPSGLFGIQPLEPGYARFQVKPQPASLTDAAITVPTVRGVIGASFEKNSSGNFQFVIDVPGNAVAAISIPVSEDTTDVYVDGERLPVSVQNGYASLPDTGMGCHVVSEVWNDAMCYLCDSGTSNCVTSSSSSSSSSSSASEISATSDSSSMSSIKSSSSVDSSSSVISRSSLSSLSSSSYGAIACSFEYTVSSQWGVGFVGSVSVTNTGTEPVNNWQVSWQYVGDNSVLLGWGANLTTEPPYTASGLPWNTTIPAGQSVKFGFLGSLQGGSAEVPVLSGRCE